MNEFFNIKLPIIEIDETKLELSLNMPYILKIVKGMDKDLQDIFECIYIKQMTAKETLKYMKLDKGLVYDYNKIVRKEITILRLIKEKYNPEIIKDKLSRIRKSKRDCNHLKKLKIIMEPENDLIQHDEKDIDYIFNKLFIETALDTLSLKQMKHLTVIIKKMIMKNE